LRPRSRPHVFRLVIWIALGLVVIGVFSTWTTAGSVTLNGTEGPNNGWLVVILAVPALAWSRMMERDSWTGAVGVVGLLGVSIVILGTALENWADNREVLQASVGHGLLLVVAAGATLALAAAFRGIELLRSRTGA
jgi:drug/metabolite transporter (DMT)-like permease